MKNYDKKVRQTRILLEDYLLLKGYAQRAGVSMSEALHTIITRDWALGRSVTKAIKQPVFSVKVPVTKPVRQPVFRVKVPAVIATNGSKMPAFRIKTKGVKYA